MHERLKWLADLMSTATTREEVRTAEMNQRAFLNVAAQALAIAVEALDKAAENGDTTPHFIYEDIEYNRYRLATKVKRLDEEGHRAG